MSAIDVALTTLEGLCTDPSVNDEIRLQAAATILSYTNGMEITFERDGDDIEVDR